MDAAKLNYETDQLINQPFPSEEEAVDLAGELGYIIQKLQGYKRALLAEIDRPVDGKQYRTVSSRSAKRSYNTAGLMAAFDHDLKGLMAADAVRLTWRWTELKNHAYREGVTLSIAPREIEDDGDLDDALIGEVWNEEIRVEGV